MPLLPCGPLQLLLRLRDLADKGRWPPTREDIEQADTGAKLFLNFAHPLKSVTSIVLPIQLNRLRLKPWVRIRAPSMCPETLSAER